VSKVIIAWWSGGVTSAVACKIALDTLDEVKVVMLDTMNEDEDTYRFLKDCENWYGVKIDVFKHPDYESIEDVWRKYKSLSSATGAVCSNTLKNYTREIYCKGKNVEGHVFGFEYHKKEMNRAKNWERNHNLKAFFPLIDREITKLDAMQILKDQGIELPRVYGYGFNNNNCFKTGCTQGGIGYWQKIKDDFPEKFDKMAEMEHELSRLKGEPVVICHDQRKIYDIEKYKKQCEWNELCPDDQYFDYTNIIQHGRLITKWDISKRSGKPNKKSKLFLKHNSEYPEIRTIDVIKGKHTAIIEEFECNGFCGLEDNGNKLDFMELIHDK